MSSSNGVFLLPAIATCAILFALAAGLEKNSFLLPKPVTKDHAGQAQQNSGKLKLNLSEQTAAAAAYVDTLSNHQKDTLGTELSTDQKTKIVNSILCGIEAQGTYALVPAPSCPPQP